MVDGRYFTPQQAAEILACDDEQIVHWINSGQLTAVNVAKDPNGKRPRWRISEADLGRFCSADATLRRCRLLRRSLKNASPSSTFEW